MNVVWAVVIILAVTGAAVAAMLVVRRRAPDGGHFKDGDRASGVFGVLATGFSVLLGFLIFLAFESYDASRVGAESEAVTVAQQFETAQLMPAEVSEDLSSELVCYARYVVEEEWDRMEAGNLGSTINPWGVASFLTVEGVEPGNASEEEALGKWLDQTLERQEARQHRVHGAVGVIPTPLWIALFFITAIIVVYLLCFADSGEGARIQALLMGSVVAAITAMLLVLSFLNDPYTDSVGGVQPDAMKRTLIIMDEAIEAIGVEVDAPCDASGQPR
jgi:hypothetical protein